MRKKKKRLQMQTVSEEQAMRQVFDESVALGLIDRVGTDAKGEPLYSINPNAEARAEVLRKLMKINSHPDMDE